MTPRARAERRHNRSLREVLDELLTHTREIARRAKQMTPAELDYAQQRLESTPGATTAASESWTRSCAAPRRRCWSSRVWGCGCGFCRAG